MEIRSKGIVKNGFFSIVQILVATLAYALVYYLILRTPNGKAQIGMWSTITGIPAALTIFGSGVSGCLIRYIPLYVADKDYRQVKLIILNGLIFNGLIAFVICLAGWAFAYPLLRFGFKVTAIPPVYLTIYYYALAAFFINFVGSVLLFSLDGLQLIFKKNVILMISSLAFCVLAVLMIRLYGIRGVVYAQLLQAILVFSLSAGILWKIGAFGEIGQVLSRAHQKLFLTYGQGMQAISFSIMLFDPITRLFITRYYSLDIVAMYDMVNQVVTRARSLIVTAIQVIMPVVSKQHKENKLDIRGLFLQATRGGMLLSFVGFSTLLLLAVPLILFFKDGKNLHYYLVFLSMLSACYLVNIISSVPYSIMMGMGKLKHVIISHLLSTGINFVLFVALRKESSAFLALLPPFTAITLSSAYILYIFARQHPEVSFSVPAEDRILYLIPIGFLAGAAMARYFSANFYWLMAINGIYGLLVIYLLFKNTFLAAIRERLFLKEGHSAGA